MVSSILFSRVLKTMLNISQDKGRENGILHQKVNSFVFHITPVNSAKL